MTIPASTTLGAQRMRRLRKRREKGIVATIPVHLYGIEVERLIAQGLLALHERNDRKALRRALSKVLGRYFGWV